MLAFSEVEMVHKADPEIIGKAAVCFQEFLETTRALQLSAKKRNMAETLWAVFALASR